MASGVNGHLRHALLAGGAGFIGSHLTDALLDAGWAVTVLDNLHTGRRSNLREAERRRGFAFVEADIVDQLPAMIMRGNFDAVLNLACPASPPHYQADPERTLMTCVLGTRQLLRLAERTGARFLQASTSEIYGDPEMHPQREEYVGHVSCIGPRACYDEGKRAAETLCFDYARSGRVDVRVARIFNTYGPRMRSDDGRVVSNVVCQALSGAPITIYGDGSQTRSFCYVDDLVRGLLLLLIHGGAQPGPVNLGNPVELTVRDLVEKVRVMTGSRSPVVSMSLPIDDPRRRRPDIARAEALLGWSPRVALADGLAATVEAFAAELLPVTEARRAARK